MKPVFLAFLFFGVSLCFGSEPIETVKKYFSLADDFDCFILDTNQNQDTARLKRASAGLCRAVFTASLLDSQIARSDSLIESGLAEEVFPCWTDAVLTAGNEGCGLARVKAEAMCLIWLGSEEIICRDPEAISARYALTDSSKQELKRQIALHPGKELELHLRAVLVVNFSLKSGLSGWRIYDIKEKYRETKVSTSFY